MSASVTIGGVTIGDTGGTPRVLADSVLPGSDDANGIVGSSTATFTIVANPRDALPSLAPFTPCQIEIDGARVWSGYVWTHVRTGRSVAVECQGTKTHLNAALLSIAPVNADMSGWQDVGLLSNAGYMPATYSPQDVTVGAGGIVLTYPVTTSAPTVLQSIQVVNAAIPFGAKAIKVAYAFSGSVAGRFRIWTTNTLAFSGVPAYAADVSDTTQGGILGVALSPALYVCMAFGFTSSTISVAQTCTITMCWIYDTPIYYVHASDVAARVASLVPQISTDHSQILPTPTVLGHAAWPPPGASPTAILSEVGAYDDALIGVDAYDRLVFAPRVSTPALELGAACPPVSESPSDPSPLVSEVVVDGSDSTGRKLSLTYNLLDLPELGSKISPNVSVPNGDMSLGLGYWWPSSGTALTNVATGGPIAGGRYMLWTPTGGGNLSGGEAVYNALAGTFKAGVPYRLAIYLSDASSYPAWKTAASTLSVWLYDPNDLEGVALAVVRNVAGWAKCSLTWTPRQDCSGAYLSLYNQTPRNETYSDGYSSYYALRPVFAAASISELAVPGALVSRQVRRSGQITVPIIAFEGLALLIAQSYLRGSIRQSYTAIRDAVDGAARHPATHAPLPAAALLSSVGSTVRIADRVDPASGAVGASGYVSGVSYEHAARKAQVTIGERYGNYQELLSRVVNAFGA